MSGTRQAFPSRRRLLRGAGGAGLAVAASVAAVAAGAGTAHAGTDGDVVLGAGNTATNVTTVTNTADGGTALLGVATVTAGFPGGAGVAGQSDNGAGVAGHATGSGTGLSGVGDTGVQGFGDTGPGVLGDSLTGVGVSGHSDKHWGMFASSNSDTALQAQSNNAVAVVAVAVSGKTGVYAQSGTHDGFRVTSDAIRGYTDAVGGAGVRGENFFGGDGVTGFTGGNPPGNGVAGTTTSDTGGRAGVAGTNRGPGPGVHGIGGTGVLAEASALSFSIALMVRGPARFSLSGLVTVAAGSSKATVTGVKLTSASMVLATLQDHLPGISIDAAVADFAGSKITVHLSKPATLNAKVAWFVVN